MAKQRRYPPEFRRRVLELIRAGQSIHATAQKFDVSRQTIMSWVKQDDSTAVVRAMERQRNRKK